jgi:hypothetical protein
MNIAKLFGVLVVGGSLLTAGCGSEDDTGRVDANAAQVGNAGDGGSASDASAATPDASTAELEECGFCPNECCVYDDEGNGAAMEGFVCCWGTEC